MMDLLIQILAGLVVAAVVAVFGISKKSSVTIRSGNTRKTGKKIIIVSMLMIIGGAIYGGNYGMWDFNNYQSVIGATLVGYGLLFLIVGRLITWYQKD